MQRSFQSKRRTFSGKRQEFGGKNKNHGNRQNFGRKQPRFTREVSSKKEIEGVIKLAGKKGGFVELDKDREVQIYPAFLGTALHNDTVKVLIHHDGTGEVIDVLTRSRNRFVGLIENDKFIPDDRRFYLDTQISPPAPSPYDKGRAGEEIEDKKVLVEITDWKSSPLKGKIIDILGEQGSHETEIKSILAAGGIVYDFPVEVEQEARNWQAKYLNLIPEEIKSRRDMRDTLTFTIDPADAKDFDDALSLKSLGNGKWEVGVHIADVSYFVRPGTELDREARERANSVYLVDRTVPMLPEVLSADICSLVPNQDRLTYSAIFVIDSDGKVESEWFGRTIIHSQKRFTYEEAADLLSGKSVQSAVEGPALLNELGILNNLSKKLHQERLKSGSIIFEKDEVKIELDKNKKPIRIYIKESLPTNKLIEEFMLLANKHVARYLSRSVGNLGGGTVYRIHDKPDPERIEALLAFLRSLGYKFEGQKDNLAKNFGASQINELFAQMEGEDIESLVHTAVLRSMAKAIYSTSNLGHFGLGFEHYTHFTSPIRRYPDLMVHRLLTKYLEGKPIDKLEVANYERVLKHSSVKEKEATDAERESIKYKQAEYMSTQQERNPRNIYEGIITGVTEWGIFAEDQITKCEGMLRLSSLGDDYYEFDEKKFALVGRKSKKVYRLGDKLKVKLSEVDIPRHQITWELAMI
ncbi:MAG: ribonuclease R [Patescibacteria group bacterium]